MPVKLCGPITNMNKDFNVIRLMIWVVYIRQKGGITSKNSTDDS